MNIKVGIILSACAILLAACATAPQIQAGYDPAALKFDGEQAFALETEFVTRFPDRASGYPNNPLAAAWISDYMSNLGWECSLDRWEIVNYSRPLPLKNVVCKLPGKSDREIIIMAHLDQSTLTSQGADDNAVGIAAMMHLGELFTREKPLPYTLVIVGSDAEEYGMVGSGRFIETHPDPQSIIAAIIIDNVGRFYYDGINLEQIGQYRNYGDLWLALAAKESASRAGLWPVAIPGVVDQITGQMAPISFLDQGPFVAAGVPAVGMYGHKPIPYLDQHFQWWHDPGDTLETTSASALGNAGLVAEALIRQLLGMETYPEETGPYVFLEGSRQVLRGWPLQLIFAIFVGLFFLGSLLTARTPILEKVKSWKPVLPHFLSFWLPLVAFVLLLYLFVETGVLLKFYRYTAATKDPYLTQPNWFIFGLALAGLAVFMYLGRRLARRIIQLDEGPSFGSRKSFALFMVGLAGIYVMILNPFSLLFFVPLLFWFLISGRSGWRRIFDIVFFLLGGLMVYALIYMFGFLTLHYNFAFLWMLLNMIADRLVSFPSMCMITAIIAAGLAMVVSPTPEPGEKVVQALSPAGA